MMEYLAVLIFSVPLGLILGHLTWLYWVSIWPKITVPLAEQSQAESQPVDQGKIDRELQELVRKLSYDTFHCPCGKTYHNAAKYFAHQDKCWAWGHYDCLVMTRNKLGGYQTKGDRYIIPKNGKGSGNIKERVYVPDKPTYLNYSGKWEQHTSPLCGEAWVKAFKNGNGIDMPEPSIDITFDSNGAIRPVTLATLAEVYPKMIKRFGDRIKIT